MYSSGKIVTQTLMTMKLITVKTKEDKFQERVRFWIKMFNPRTQKWIKELRRSNRKNPDGTAFKTAETVKEQNEAIRIILNN